MPVRTRSSHRPNAGRTAMRHALAGFALIALTTPLAHANQAASDIAPKQDPAAAWQHAGQMLVVVTPAWDATHGTLHTFAREHADEGWTATDTTFEVSIGRSGLGWGIGLHPPQPGDPAKAEGDGRAPAGVFAIGTAFGAADRVSTRLPYAAMTDTHHCIDVPASPLYNRIVDTREVGDAAIEGSTEPMRRDIHLDGDRRYLQGFVIDHNPQHRPGAGSCIFAHLWNTPRETTAGCIAMDDVHMQALLDWLDAARAPVLVQLPADEYTRLQAAWSLPLLPKAADTAASP